MLLRTVTGNESFREGSAKYHVLVPSQNTLTLSKEMFITEAAKMSATRIAKLNTNKLNAGPVQDMGVIWDNQWDVPDGLIIKVFGQRQAAGGRSIASGGLRRSASMYLQMRRGASLQRILFTRVGAAIANQGEMLIEGEFDRIDWRSAVEQGVNMDPRFMGQFDERRYEGLFSVNVIREAVTTRSVARTERVRNDSGETVEVKTVANERAVDLD